MERVARELEELLGDLEACFRRGEGAGGEASRRWSTLAAHVASDVVGARAVGMASLEGLTADDDFAEEVVLFVAKTLRLAGHEQEAMGLLSEALAHPLFRGKERALTWIDDMQGDAVRSAYVSVLESCLAGRAFFSEQMAALALFGLAYEGDDTATELALRFLGDEESPAFGAAIDYLIRTRQVARAPALARAIHRGGTREDISRVLSALRAWRAVAALPALQEMLALDWVNLERTRPVKAELEEAIAELALLPRLHAKARMDHQL